MKNLILILCLAALAAAAPLPGATPQEEKPALITRTFEIRYKDFQDALLIVTDVVAREGSEHSDVSFNSHLKRITVTDLRGVVEAVAKALESFDVPPRQVEIKMTLFLGSRDKQQEAADSVFSSVVAQLREALRYTSYEVLGSLRVPVVEGEETSVTMGSGYTVQFVVGRVDPRRRLVQLSPLVLSRRVPGAAEGASEQLLATTLNLTADQEMVLGASSDPSSDRALVLAMVGRILD